MEEPMNRSKMTQIPRCRLIQSEEKRSFSIGSIELELSHHSVVLLNVIGINYLQTGQNAEAKQHFIGALHMHYEENKPRQNLHTCIIISELEKRVPLVANSFEQKTETADRQIQEFDEGLYVHNCGSCMDESTNCEDRYVTLLYNIGQACIRMKQYEDAKTWLELCLTAMNQDKERPSQSRALQFVKIWHNLGYCNYCLGHYEASMYYYERVLNLANEYDLGQLEAAAASNCIAVLLFKSSPSQSKTALELLRISLSTYEQIVGGCTREVATFLSNIGTVHFVRAEYDQALTAFSKALEIRQQFLNPDSPDVVIIRFYIGRTHDCHDSMGKAISYYEQTIESIQNTFGICNHAVVASYTSMAKFYAERGDLNRSRHLFEKVLKAGRITLGDDHVDLAGVLHDIGSFYKKTKYYNAALEYLLEGLRISKRDPTNPNRITILLTTIDVYASQGDVSAALDAYHQLYLAQTLINGYTSLEVASTLKKMGHMFFNLEQFEEALGCFKEALKIFREYFGLDNHSTIASALKFIGDAYIKLGEFQSAENAFASSMRICKKLPEQDHREIIALRNTLANIAVEKGDEEKAIKLYKATIVLGQKSRKQCQADVAVTFQQLGQLYERRGELDAAIMCFDNALDILQSCEDINPTLLSRLSICIGRIQLPQNNIGGMMKSYIEAARISPRDMAQENHDYLAVSCDRYYVLSRIRPDCAGAA